MVIEVVSWPGTRKRHAVNPNMPLFTLCGAWIPQAVVEKHSGLHDFPTCMHCHAAVMRS